MNPQVKIIPLTPDRWPDLVRLFGPRGACAGCWCMWWRRPAREWKAGRGAETSGFERPANWGD